MILKRKIDQVLLHWKKNPLRNPLVVCGVRQCGKTFSVTQFANAHYSNVVYLNVANHPEVHTCFSEPVTVKDTERIKNIVGLTRICPPNDTILILDEIDACPQALTALPAIKEVLDLDVIAISHSLANLKATESVTTIVMHPLGFEECLWAHGLTEAVIERLKTCLENGQPVPLALHNRLLDLGRKYVAVGGMPAVLDDFLVNHNLQSVRHQQQALLQRLTLVTDGPRTSTRQARINACIDAMPQLLMRQHKKFQYAAIREGARASQYKDALAWLEKAGVIFRSRQVTSTQRLLEDHVRPEAFKVYFADIGLLMSTLPKEVAARVLLGDLMIHEGALMESLVAESFHKAGRPLFYFEKPSGLQISFLIDHQGSCVPISTKPKSGNDKTLKTVLAHPEKYACTQATKVGLDNIGYANGILTIPFYLLLLMDRS